MKIAIIGADVNDTLEFHLHEAFCFAGHKAKIFDIYDRNLFCNRFSKYTKTLDKLLRDYSNSYDVKVFNRLANLVNDFNPDLVVCVYRFIHPCFVKAVKAKSRKVIHINPDAITTFEKQQVFASEYDAWFTKDPYIVKFMKNNMHLNVFQYNEAFNTRVHIKPECTKAECEEIINMDVMTYGTLYPYRTRMLKVLLDNDIDLKVFGTVPNRFYNHEVDKANQHRFITGAEKAELLYGAKIVFNQMHFAEIEGVNNRFFEVNGSGAFQLSDYRPILKDLLPIDPELVSFKSIDEGVEKIKYYLAHPQERYEIVDKIYQHFIKHYSYDNLVSYIIKKTYN